MKVSICFALAMALAIPTTAAAQPSSLDTDWSTVSSAARSGDCDAGLPGVAKVTGRPEFQQLPDNARLSIWSFGAACAAKSGNMALALADADAGTGLPNAPDWLWALRIEVSIGLKQGDDAARALEITTAMRPRAVASVPFHFFRTFQLQQVAIGNAEPLRRVVSALERSGYEPPSPTDSFDFLWIYGARDAIDAGDAAHAEALLNRITTAEYLIQARLDARFATIVAKDPNRYDPKAAEQRQLERDEAIMKSHGELLDAVNSVAHDLRVLERSDEALALVQSAIDRANSAPVGKPPYSDQAAYLNWSEDVKVRALWDLGRTDEALAAERAAALVPENGRPNVSQVMNLAGYLNSIGRPDEALSDLDKYQDGLNQASGYGFGVVHEERARAYALLGRNPALGQELAYLSAHRSENPGAYLDALFYAGDLDGAAAAIIAGLKDSERRGDLLVTLSNTDPPRHTTADAATFLARVRSVRQRADVQAAITAVGHVEKMPLCGCALGSSF